jgi:hypothetical protein
MRVFSCFGNGACRQFHNIAGLWVKTFAFIGSESGLVRKSWRKIGIVSDPKTHNIVFNALLPNQPLSTDKTYRMVASYGYRGRIEQTTYEWVIQHVHVLNRFLPAPRKGLATSEWFVVKPEASQANPE